jgi:hypothetical protein
MNSRTRTVVAVGLSAAALVSLAVLRDGASAQPPSPNDPRSWVVDGKVDESRVPARVPMSSDSAETPLVYIDPHRFYLQLGARPTDTGIPVFDFPTGGNQVGSFDLSSGVLTLDNGSVQRPNDTAGASHD